MPRTHATFERAGVAVTATYLGERAWSIATEHPPPTGEDTRPAHRVDNASVSRAIRDALGLAAPSPPETRIEVRAANLRHGAIANDTVPASAWWFDVDPGVAGVAPDLEAAIWGCLSGLRLAPSSRAVAPSRSVDPRFGSAALGSAPDLDAWAAALARCGEQWLGADAALDDVHAFLAQLRALGHPLHSFDEDDDFVTWATWGPERRSRDLVIEVRLPPYEAPVVTVTLQDRDQPG